MNFSFLPTRKRSAKAGRNAIFTLTFYRHNDQWVFDDDRRDIADLAAANLAPPTPPTWPRPSTPPFANIHNN